MSVHQRLQSIDVLRALAILLMVQIHFVDYLTPPGSGPDWLRDLSEVLGDLPAPLFTFLVGMSLCLSLDKQAAQGRSQRAIARRTLKRGLAIFGLGLLVLLLVWGPEEVFTWDILTFIGLAIVALYPLRRLPSSYLLLIALLVLLTSPWLRQKTHFARFWDAGFTEYRASLTVKDLLWGATANGYFPVLPWITFPLAGFATARIALPRMQPRVRRDLLRLGLALLALGLGGALVNSLLSPCKQLACRVLKWYAAPLTFYPASTTYLLATLGLILVVFRSLHLRLDLRPAPRPWLSFLDRYSRYALTTYVAHLAAHIWPIALLGAAQHADRWTYYQNAASLPAALGLAALFVFLFYVTLIYWDRHRGKYSLEWLLRKIVSPSPDY